MALDLAPERSGMSVVWISPTFGHVATWLGELSATTASFEVILAGNRSRGQTRSCCRLTSQTHTLTPPSTQ